MPRRPTLRCLLTFAIAFLPPLTTTAQDNDPPVRIELDRFGAGNAFRPGEYTAIRLKLTSNLDDPTSVWVQWEVPNADGDIGEYGRSLTLQPGRTSPVWLYAPLSPTATMQSVWPVVVFAESDGKRGRELGGRIISPGQSSAQIVEMEQAMIGVIGRQRGGLDLLSAVAPGQSPQTPPPSALETTRIVSGIKPSELPDRWDGLRCFAALYWSDAPPGELRDDPARALANYIQRGGHLIINLPARGNPWGLGRPGMVQQDLERILPARDPPQEENVPLSELLEVLTKNTSTRTNPDLTIRVFTNLRDDNWALSNAYEPLIALADGRVLVIQRRYGMGRITLIGVEFGGQLASMGVPQADRFWNRILGHRADTPSGVEFMAIDKAKRLARTNGGELTLGSGQLFSGYISLTEQAGVGLLLAMVLFIAYWVVAGPGGYAVLKSYRQVHHAWLAFAACSMLFTLGAYFSTRVFQKELKVRHFTVLDHIARPRNSLQSDEPQLQRAASWFTFFTPKYGRTPLSLKSTPGQRDLLISWHPPNLPVQRFPNIDRFQRNVGRSEAILALPSRATSTQVYAHWMGGVPRSWGGMIREDPDNPIRVRMDTLGEREVGLSGNLLHDLPGVLVNIQMFWVHNQRTPPRGYTRTGPNRHEPWVEVLKSGKMLNQGDTWAFGQWSRNESLSLALDLKPENHLERSIKKNYFDPYEGSISREFSRGNAQTPKDRRRYLEMLSIFHQLTPPTYLKLQEKDPNNLETVRPHRLHGRELDLSAWFTRPCLIVIGYLENSPIPIPLRVNGEDEAPPSSGLTMIRWIYPLPLDPDLAFPQ